jgi:hypothetical protein
VGWAETLCGRKPYSPAYPLIFPIVPLILPILLIVPDLSQDNVGTFEDIVTKSCYRLLYQRSVSVCNATPRPQSNSLPKTRHQILQTTGTNMAFRVRVQILQSHFTEILLTRVCKSVERRAAPFHRRFAPLHRRFAPLRFPDCLRKLVPTLMIRGRQG